VDISDDKHFYHDCDNEKIKIYSCTVSNSNPVTWADVKEKSQVYGYKYPVGGLKGFLSNLCDLSDNFQIKKALWIIRYNTTKYYYLSQFLKLFYHFLPALLIDTFLEYNNKEPKLLKIYRKVNKFSEVLSFFTNNEWNFDDKNMKGLCNA
jgi:alcohol-forming fatty acyl-CoA reductase